MGPDHPVRVTADGDIRFLPVTAPSKRDPNEIIEVYVTEEEHEALLSVTIFFDWHLDVIKAAEVTEDGMMFKGKRSLIDDLAGWAANEANHVTRSGKSRRRAGLLNDACDAIEDALR
ncbi:MAG: hypothetical protein HY815_28355 [Candidatus Riflebacteria bacterium]|nr:hypothetical protein [Candidatus Riflebacteria bacterium]